MGKVGFFLGSYPTQVHISRKFKKTDPYLLTKEIKTRPLQSTFPVL